MTQFFGVARHEFRMSIRRTSLWIAYGLLFLFYGGSMIVPIGDATVERILDAQVMSEAAYLAFTFNLFMPLIGGILAADRMQRDFKLGVRELQRSTPLGTGSYILGKYVGVLASLLVPIFLWELVMDGLMVGVGLAPASFIPDSLLAFLAINVPAFAFVVAFSLACPLVLPLRVYQVLFTGYWFWGNFLNSAAFPTISNTVLNASGRYALEGFFNTTAAAGEPIYTALQAWLNLGVLAACVILVFVVVVRYFAWQTRQA